MPFATKTPEFAAGTALLPGLNNMLDDDWNWKENVNAGGKNLSNLGVLTFGGSGYISGLLPVEAGATAVMARLKNSAGWVQIQSDTGVNRIVSLNAAASGSQPLVFNGQGGVEFARIAADGKIGIGTDTPTAKLQVVGLASYADNAAAVAAGLTVGAFYHTAGTLKVVI